MIVSMTGFGDATDERDGTHYSVDIPSLNNRFFKAAINFTDNVSGIEPEIEATLREQLGHLMLNEFRPVPIDKTTGQRARHAQPRIDLAQKQRPAIAAEPSAGEVGHDFARPKVLKKAAARWNTPPNGPRMSDLL